MRLFSAHIQDLLGAYCHGELPAKETFRVETHLRNCSGCRREYEAFLKGDSALEQLPSVAAPNSLWVRIEAELPATGAGKVSSAETTPNHSADGKTAQGIPGLHLPGAKPLRNRSYLFPGFSNR